MDNLAKVLNITPIDFEINDYGNTPLEAVPCFIGWQKRRGGIVNGD